MGACVSVQKESSQTSENPLLKLFTKSSDPEADRTILIGKQKNALKLIYQDLAQRSGNGELNSRIFQQFFNLNRLWGSAMFRKFSEDKANHYGSAITLTQQQFVDKIQKIYNSGLNQKLKFLFSVYDLDDSKGVSEREFIAILIGSPQQEIKELLCEDGFLQSLSVTELAYILTNATQNLAKYNKKSGNENALQSSGYLSTIKLPNQTKAAYSNQIQLGLPVQDHQQSSLTLTEEKQINYFLSDKHVKQQIKLIIKKLDCITILIRAYARFVFNKEGINDSKNQIKFEDFRKIVVKYPIIFQACFEGFHEYLWRYKLGEPMHRTKKTKISSLCKYLQKKKQKKVFLKFIQNSFLIFDDSSEQDLLQIINLQGLQLTRIHDHQHYGFMLSHQSGVYPEKQFYFKTEQMLQRWLRLTINYQQNDILQRYDIMQLIDKGRYGNVHRCKDLKTNQIKAVKIISKYLQSQNERSAIDSQLQILKACEQFNVVQAHATYQTKTNLYIVMEYLNDGTLFDYIKRKNKKHLEQEEAKQMMKKLLKTVSQLHSIGIIHRDLKLNNIMIKYQDKQVIPIIIDFGIAVYKINVNKISEERKFIGCANFTAPQVYNHEQFDEKIDVFSLGVIMYYLLCGYLPFDSFDSTIIRQSVCACKVQFIHTRWKKISQQAKRLILKMICFKQNRISCEEALHDQWFQDYDKSTPLKKKRSADM